MGEGGPNEWWGVRKPPLRTCVDVNASPGTPYATHTLHRGTLSECLFFFSIYLLLARQLWCFQLQSFPPGIPFIGSCLAPIIESAHMSLPGVSPPPYPSLGVPFPFPFIFHPCGMLHSPLQRSDRKCTIVQRTFEKLSEKNRQHDNSLHPVVSKSGCETTNKVLSVKCYKRQIVRR